MGHSSRSSSSRHAQMTSAGASSPLCAPQKQSSMFLNPSPQTPHSITPPRDHLPSSTQKHPRSPAGYKGGLFVGSLRAGGEGGAVQKGHCSLLSCLAGSSVPVRSRCIPHLELAECLASPLPRGPALWRSHPSHSAPSMPYLGIQHQKRLSLESSKSSASSPNGLSCECWGGESVFWVDHNLSLFLSLFLYLFL